MKTIYLILFSILLTSCSNNQESGFVTLSKASLHGAGEEGFKEENVIIQSETDWKEFLSKLDSTNKVSDRFGNKIDFSKNTIIAVFDKVQTSGGFSIEVSKIETKDSTLEVFIKKDDGGKSSNGMAIMIMDQPYHIIKLSKTDKKIVFKKLDE